MMIASPFDDAVRFVALALDDADAADAALPLLPAEEVLLTSQMVPRRRRELRLGRAAARAALRALLGVDPAPVMRGAHGEPRWPAGVVGSITHARDVVVAAVARRVDSAGLGIDVERRDRRVDPGVARLVCGAEERAWVEEPGGALDAGLRLKLLFSAKEAVFKALYPLASVYLGYKDATLVCDEGAGRFRARLLRDAGPGHAAGRVLDVGFRLSPAHLFTFLRLAPPSLAA